MRELKQWIKGHEGLFLKPYKDTVNKTTIGYGRNIEDNGISVKEADMMFENDFSQCLKDLSQYTWYTEQPTNIQNALMDMCFNMGIHRLLTFKKMLAAIEAKDYTMAAIEALDSKWALQVKNRAKDVALVIKEGWN